MNFQNIPPVPRAQELLEGAIKQSKKQSKNPREQLFSMYLDKKLSNIIQDFPSFDAMDDFYKEATNQVIDLDETKKALSTIKWGKDKIVSLSRSALKEDFPQFLGRASSVMKRLDPKLILLDESRKNLKDLPDIKKLFTVCIAGFPNVGKSTLLSKITSSKPEIKNYAFTTKRLNTGYFDFRMRKIQVIDTPGTLARFEKMNNIEKLAFLAIKYKADVIVFVADPSNEEDYEIQSKLLEIIKKYGRPIVYYISKTDITSKEKVKKLIDYLKIKDPCLEANVVRTKIVTHL